MMSVSSDHPLRRVRRRRGLTLAVLADRSGLSAPFLSMVETGQRSLSTRVQITTRQAGLASGATVVSRGLPGVSVAGRS